MKRFFVIFLSVLLILPVLVVPCLAVSDDIISNFHAYCTGIFEGDVYYRADVELVSGWYKFLVAFPVANMVLETDPVYLSFTSYNEDIFVAQFILPFPVDGSTVDFPVTVVTSTSITLLSTPAFMDVAGYSESYVSLESVQTDVVSSLASVGTAVLSWISGIVAVIVERPLLLFTVGIFFVGACIGLFARLLSRN